MKKNSPSSLFRNVLAIGAACAVGSLGSPSARAQTTYTWQAPGSSTSFGDAANWSPGGGPPTAADSVVFSASNSTLQISGSTEVFNFTSSSSSPRTFQRGGSGGTYTFKISGTLAKSGSGNLLFRQNSSINNRLNLDIGEINLSNGLLALGSATADGHLNAVTVGSASISGGSWQSVVGVTSGTVNVTGDLNFTGTGIVRVRERGASATLQTGVLNVGSLSSSGTNGVVEVNQQGSGNAVTGFLRLNNASGTSTYGGVLRDGGTVGNVLHVEKNNSGTQVLAGVNTYSGSTTINAGSLIISGSGSINSSADVTINGGAFLYDSSASLTRNVTVGGGSFLYDSAVNYGGSLTFNSGTLGGKNLNGLSLTGGNAIGAGKVLSPGNSPGTLAVDDVDFEDGGGYLWEINSLSGTQGLDPGWDWIDGAGGVLDLSSLSANGFTLQIDSLGALSGWDTDGTYSWTIASFDSIVGFNAGNFGLDISAFGDQNDLSGGAFSLQLNGNDLVLHYDAIPEPSAGLTACFSLAALYAFRRRRKNA